MISRDSVLSVGYAVHDDDDELRFCHQVPTMDDDFDFDRAASAFPDISLDGTGDLPSFPAVPAPAPPSAFSFDNFGSPPRQSFTDVKVTGDEEIEKFEDQFPELDVGHVRLFF